jgi:hypothetical protein
MFFVVNRLSVSNQLMVFWPLVPATLQVQEQGEGIGCVESYGDQEIMIFDFAK